MSTRTRIVIKNHDKVLAIGRMAVTTLYYYAGMRKVKPVGMKQEKMRAMAKYLPAGYSLVLIQEPRRTRKAYSLYWQMRAPKKGRG